MADAPAAPAPVDTPPAAPAPVPVPQPVAPATPAAPAVPASQPGATDDATTLRADLERMRAEARKHEDRWKSRDEQLEKQNALLRTLAEKAGIEVDGKPDPEKLIQQLTSAKQVGQDTARELAVFRAAAATGADPDALLDSRGFMAKTAGLDPSASDFNDRIKALVAEAATANPKLAAQPVPPAPVQQPAPPVPAQLPASSGGDFSGAPPGNGQWTEQDVENASPEALSKAIDQGLLRDLGHAPRRHGRNR